MDTPFGPEVCVVSAKRRVKGSEPSAERRYTVCWGRPAGVDVGAARDVSGGTAGVQTDH